MAGHAMLHPSHGKDALPIHRHHRGLAFRSFNLYGAVNPRPRSVETLITTSRFTGPYSSQITTTRPSGSTAICGWSGKVFLDTFNCCFGEKVWPRSSEYAI